MAKSASLLLWAGATTAKTTSSTSAPTLGARKISLGRVTGTVALSNLSAALPVVSKGLGGKRLSATDSPRSIHSSLNQVMKERGDRHLVVETGKWYPLQAPPYHEAEPGEQRCRWCAALIVTDALKKP